MPTNSLLRVNLPVLLYSRRRITRYRAGRLEEVEIGRVLETAGWSGHLVRGTYLVNKVNNTKVKRGRIIFYTERLPSSSEDCKKLVR